MLKDLLPRILLFGRKVPKAIPVVADAMAFIVAVPTQLWDSGVGKNGPEANASSVVQACLEALGDSHEQPPADALACVAQVLASLLHRRQQVVTAIGPAGAESLLVKLNRWSLQSIDANVEPLARGYRTFCMGSAAPAPEGLGGPLLPPPAWLTPVMVCAHQLLISVDLVQLRQGRESLSNEVQKSWVTGVLDILYAFPGAEPGLALASIQLLLRLCSAQIGAHAFLEYQPRLSLDADGKLKVPSETAGGMIVLLRLARKTIFTGMLQMVADLAVTLMEEGPALQARMETEILGLFSQQVKTLPIKQIASRLNPLFIRNPDIFGEALKAVTQKAQSSDQSSIVLEPLPESERSKQKPAPHPGALVMLQTLVAEICFNLELQHSTAFPKIFDASKRPEPEDAAKGEKGKKDEKKKEKEDKEEEKEQASKESKEEAGKEPSKLPPLFPLALDSNALLFVLDALVSRVPGMSALTMKPALPLGTNPSSLPENSLVVPDRQDKAPPKSLLLMMTRHLMPRFAQLADVWQEQIQPLSHSQRMHLTHTGAIIPMQKCMPHLATTLASTARLCVEPRRALASEVVLSTKALAETEKSEKSQSLSFSTEVAAVCGLVARLLGAAAAADRKEDKEDEEAQSRPGTSDAKDSQRKAKGKKESSVFCNQSETQALRESLVAILLRTDLQCTVVMAVATGIVKCLEFLTRRETKKSGAQGPLPEPEEAVVPSAAEFAVEFSVPDGAAHDELDRDEDEEDDEEEEDDDDLAEEEDEEAMAGIDGGHLPEHEDFADDDYDAEFDEDYGEDDAMDFDREGDDMLHGDDGAEPNLATILNNAIHVIDQQVQGFNPDQMTMQMNFSPDLGDGPPRRAPPRAGRGAMDFLGVTVGTGWSEPGDLDLPGEHPMLRREHQSHAQPLQQMPQLAGFQMPGASGVVDMSRMVQLVPGPDAFRQIFAGSGPTGGAAGIIGGPGGAQIVITSSSNLLPPGSAGMGGAAGALRPPGDYQETTRRPPADHQDAGHHQETAEITSNVIQAKDNGSAMLLPCLEHGDVRSTYASMHRLSDELRTAPAESKEAPATEASEQAPAPEAPAAEPPVETTPTTAAEGEAAPEHPPAADVPEQVPAADVVDEASELLARLNAEEAAEQVQAADAEPQAEEPAEGGEAHAAEAVPAEEDPAAALGIAELERLASSLGCTQTALLQAAEIDASVVAELPEDMRGAVVMATLSQVNVDHLRARNSPAPGPGAPPESGGFDEIDASVLEALPPEIREEVMREEERRRREQERAQRAAETAAAQTPQAPAGAGVGMSGDMDNASFIASLDPMLREEVLMTAPEEVLQTLPAELVAEAQMIRDRAFMRIASHREGPPPAQPPPPARAPRVQPQPSARPHQYLQAMEQQLSQLAGGRRAWLHGTDGRFRQASDDFMAQLGLALGGSRSRQAAPLVAATNAGVGTPGLASFDEADRALLERLADYDEDACQGLDPPLPPSAIPNVCQLLYLRHEVTVTPLTRLFFNLSLHPATRQFTMGQFLVLLCKEPQAVGCREPSLPPAHLYEGLENGQLPISNSTEVKAVGAQRVLQILAYLLRRVPQCGEFFAKPLQKESWLEGEAPLVSGGHLSSLVGHHSVNVLLRLLTTKLFLVSSRHAAWLLAILHALLVPVKDKKPEKPDDSPAEKEQASGSPDTPGDDEEGKVKKEVPAEQQILERWSSINKNMHAVLSQESVLALCHFLCQAGSGHGSSGEADTFQMAGEILVALAASQEHLTMVRADLMRVLADLVTNIEADLAKCEPGSTEPSTMETRLLRLVRTLAEVFKEAAKASPDQELKIEDFLREARLEDLWTSLDQTLDRLHDTEVFATPAQRILSTGVAPSQLRIESSGSTNMSGTLPSNVQTTPPKPLLNRLLPLIEAFFVLHNGSKEADMEAKERQKDHEQEGGSSSSCPGKQVFADLIEVTLVERSRFGQFCKQHRRPLNALIKQTPSLLSKSFSSVLKHMPHCLDFDNKRAYFRSQLRSRRMESRYETIRLRVRRSEIFMDSYHQLRSRTGEEMRAKIQVQFQGEEGIDAGGVGKEWYGALAKEIFNPNYALFVQAGGKACTYHPNPMSYVTRDHLDFFHFIGRVIGKAIHDAQNLEAWFTRGFYKHMLGKKVIAADLEAFDPEYFSNLKWMLEHDITDIVELYFCAESDDFGQIKVVDLKPNGRSIPVTNDNKYEYIQLMSEHKMTNSVRQQIDAFLKGLHEIVPPELLSLFDDKELELLISGLPDIDIDDLKANTEYHNYTAQSDQIQWFWKVLSEFSQEQRAWFLQFATGTSRVPVEGFKGLVGMRGPQKFCIHRAYGPDRLPSAPRLRRRGWMCLGYTMVYDMGGFRALG
ncbi:UPL2 [Symbiodinium natans]|uniref:HECT-type E3 ubiquitin transferase n=1 Tax=Symbiodinium natans TaxID=878477 RepID=A0A812I576_9DINO|nr:UPL2 [Symbiodinium natans]